MNRTWIPSGVESIRAYVFTRMRPLGKEMLPGFKMMVSSSMSTLIHESDQKRQNLRLVHVRDTVNS